MPPAQPPHHLPTLYKARKVPTKQAVCAICAERTRGRTQELNMGYGVTVWLCAGHASREFQTQRKGRDLVLTLQRLWRAHGCLTAARHKALRAHLAALEGPNARSRPGSYSWPTLRTEAERHFATGARRHGDRRTPRPARRRHRPGTEHPHHAALVRRAALARVSAVDGHGPPKRPCPFDTIQPA
jgi:hypothetical protein